jgi:putative Holliday junction resolvase
MVNNMCRLMGLDIGERRIGVAVSDLLGLTAQPLEVIHRGESKRVLHEIADLVRKYEVTEFVVGLPVRTTGKEGPESERVKGFVSELTDFVGLPVHWVDERFTTTIAEKALMEKGLKTPARRQVVDKVAAALILQSYLDRRRNDGVRG